MISCFPFLNHTTVLSQAQELEDFSCSSLPLETSPLSVHTGLFHGAMSSGWCAEHSLICCHSLLGCMTSCYGAEAHKSILGLNHWMLQAIWTWLLKLFQHSSSSWVSSLTLPCAPRHNPHQQCWLLVSFPHISPHWNLWDSYPFLSWKLFTGFSGWSMILWCSVPFLQLQPALLHLAPSPLQGCW